MFRVIRTVYHTGRIFIPYLVKIRGGRAEDTARGAIYVVTGVAADESQE